MSLPRSDVEEGDVVEERDVVEESGEVIEQVVCKASIDGRPCPLCRSINSISRSATMTGATRMSLKVLVVRDSASPTMTDGADARDSVQTRSTGSTDRICSDIEIASIHTCPDDLPRETIAEETAEEDGAVVVEADVGVPVECAGDAPKPSCLYADRRKVFVKRIDADGQTVKFCDLFPMDFCFVGPCSIAEEDWSAFIGKLNRRCAKLSRVSRIDFFKDVLTGRFCCGSLGTNRQTDRIRRYIKKCNKKLFVPHGLLVLDPLQVKYEMLEVVILDERAQAEGNGDSRN